MGKTGTAHDHRVVLGIAGVAVGAWCGWASGFHRATRAAEITWLVTLAAVVLFDVGLWRGSTVGRPAWFLEPARDPWPRPGRGGGGPALRGVASWVSLILVVLAWEVLGIDSGPHQYHLTISALAQAYRPLNAALLLVWVLIGIGYEAARLSRADRKQSGTPRRATTRGSGPWWRLCSGDGAAQCPSRRAGVAPAAEPTRRRRFLGFRPSRRGAHRLGRATLARPTRQF